MTKKIKITVSLLLILTVIFLFEVILATSSLAKVTECEKYVYGEASFCCNENANIDVYKPLNTSLTNEDKCYKTIADDFTISNGSKKERENIKKASVQAKTISNLKEVPEWAVIGISVLVCAVIASMTLAIVKLRNSKK